MAITTRDPGIAGTELVTSAYGSFARFYDRFTEDYAYDHWMGGVDAWARDGGLTGHDLLDVACGTGKSFEPMLDRGYAVTACDISPDMVAEAHRKHGRHADIFVADMRRLPWEERFDLVTCMDDAVNYLLDEDDLLAALDSMHRALRPGGMVVFDTNSLATYRTTFAETFEVASGDCRFRWTGEAAPGFEPGSLASATIEIDGAEEQSESWHVQRHWGIETIRSACDEAGFGSVSFRGQVTGCHLLGEPDEELHTKIVCLAVKPPLAQREGGLMVVKG
jgi:SAM-dependent methyltransferase